jgi:hypothetical protein
VVRHASPGSKEWAAGLAREADFIESDWKALTWSLGGVRVLFHYREAPVRSMAELTKAAEKYAETQRHRFGTTNAIWITNLIQTLTWSIEFFVARSWQARLGYSLLVLGYLPLTVYSLMQSRREFDVPDRFDPAGMIRYYKAGLERVTSLFAPSFLIYAYSYTLIPVGLGIVFWRYHWSLLFDLFWVGVAALSFQKRQSNLRRLEQVDAVLSDRR